MDKINRICVEILQLSNDEIADCERVINSQIEYSHPSKQNKQQELNEIGKYNLAVMSKLKILRDALIAGRFEEINHPAWEVLNK